MTIDQIALPMMISAAVAGIVLAIAQLVGVLTYDLYEVRRQREIRQHPHARQLRVRPLVTVVVSAYNDIESIRHTLDSILHSSYRKVETLVVDLGSEDMTQDLIKGYIDLHPKQVMRLITRRENEGNRQALKRAVKQYGRGELVMAIPAGGVLYKTALLDGVRHFLGDEHLEALNTNKHIDTTASIIGLFERYHSWLMRRADKFLSVSGLTVVINRMAMYRRSAYVSNRHRRPLKIRYAHDVLVDVPAFASYPKLYRRRYGAYVAMLRGVGRQGMVWLRLGYILCSVVVSVTGPLLIGYFLYLAFYLHEATLLVLSVAGLSAFLIVAIGEEGRLKPYQKALYVFGLPVTFSLFYLLTLARFFALFGAPFKRATDTH